ncbi:LysR family transcriptional regulator [Klebsiella michiganensis]|uniref:LysR family transcriptional regulator n=1 Tax=Klebsiella michiganensis TaxID=1134687 RepID=UPI001F4AD5BD|nr:LysR family transcriptional regulator [Klebsiella michiganensis]ELQ9022426.1 LysR family transcriptional regulator [Klebsiella oxytoca]HCJ7646892.1 LysR family transcriptional regulator [Klebsiella michiganensis]
MDIPIDLKHLHTLRTLCKTGNLTRAAVALQLTQSALSHQIKQLENHYGVTLFVRKTSPVKFTHAGERLLQLAETVLHAMEEADRDLYKFASGKQGELRITLECHTCYGWLLPVMDEFRRKWAEVDIDILPGFQPDPVDLLLQNKADVAIVDENEPTEMVSYSPLFKYEMVAILPNEHPLAQKPWLEAEDFLGELLITYAVPEDRIDLCRKVLKPAGIPVRRKTTELTMGIVQQVASQRGIAALPIWAVSGYLDKKYVTAKSITKDKLMSEIWLASLTDNMERDYVRDFIYFIKQRCMRLLPDIQIS